MDTHNSITNDPLSQTFNPEIYVICAKAKFKGIDHGRWISLTQPLETITQQIKAVLSSSPIENATIAQLGAYKAFGYVSPFKHVSLGYSYINANLIRYVLYKSTQKYYPDTLMTLKTIADTLHQYGERGNELMLKCLAASKWDSFNQARFLNRVFVSSDPVKCNVNERNRYTSNLLGIFDSEEAYIEQAHSAELNALTPKERQARIDALHQDLFIPHQGWDEWTTKRYAITVAGQCFVFKGGEREFHYRKKYMALVQQQLDDEVRAVKEAEIAGLIADGFSEVTQSFEQPN